MKLRPPRGARSRASWKLLAGAAFLAVTSPSAGPADQGNGAVKTVDLTLREGTNLAAALSPDGRTLAIDLLGSLWVLPVSGGEAKRIIDELADARQPAWSPDGARIAFQSYRDGGWHIWTVAPDGTGLRQLTHGPFDEREPHWSRDGTRIAFSPTATATTTSGCWTCAAASCVR